MVDRKRSLEIAGSMPARPPTPVQAPTTPESAPVQAVAGLGNVAARLHPGAHQKAARVEILDTFTCPRAMNVSFVGVGQGGGRIADAFWKLGYRRVALLNTTSGDFEGLDAEIARLSFDIGGARKDMSFARHNIVSRKQEVYDLLSRAWMGKTDCALICAGLGGGTGSGFALPLVELARQVLTDTQHADKPRVGAIISLPSLAEGQQVARNAVTAFRELLDAKVSPLIIIDNAKVHELYHPPMSKLLPKSNELVSQLFHLFNQLGATKSTHITFDQSELAQLLDGGIVVMGAADLQVSDIEAPADVSTKIRDELAHSILADVDLGFSRKAACVFVGHKDVLDTLSLDYFDAGFTQLDRIVGSKRQDSEPTVIHRGLYEGTDAGLQCYTMLSELKPPADRLQELINKAGFTRTDERLLLAKHFGLD